MKRISLLFIPLFVLAACGGGNDKDAATKLASLKKQRSELDQKIKELEKGAHPDSARTTPVSVMDLQPTTFNSYIEVQSQITGDDVVNATARTQGIVSRVLVHEGQQVHQGQVLATLDASVAEQQVRALEPQIDLAKAVYEKQQKLWAQNIGTEVQLLTAKTNYENLLKQKSVAQAARDLSNVIAPISGTVDAVNMKAGDNAMSGSIHIVNTNKLKAEASLGENYLGKVKVGDPAMLIFTDINDTMKLKVSFVSRAVDPLSRAFAVEVHITDTKNIHPNMSCILKIANYRKEGALVVPVSVIQKNASGEVVFVAKDGAAKAVNITTGRNANGQVEVLSGLNAGDQVITAGFEDLENDEKISIQ